MERATPGRAIVLMIGLSLLSGSRTVAQEATEDGGEVVVHSPMPLPVMPVPEEARVKSVGPAPRTPEALAPPPLEPAASAPGLSLGFPAFLDNMTFIPPDTHGAAGPNHLMVTLNSQVRIQDKSGGVLYSAGLSTFFAPVAGVGGAFDPRVIYDPLGGRFVVVAADDQNSLSSALLIAVSQTSDPTGAWWFDRIPVGGSVWADFPTLGFNNRWIVVQVNLFGVGVPNPGPFNRTHIYTWQKSELYTGVFNEHLISQAGIGGTQMPAAVYDPGESNAYLLQMWNPDDTAGPGGLGYLRLWELSGADDSPTLGAVGFIAAPPWFNEASGRADFAPQMQGPPGCSLCLAPPCKIQTNDSRIQDVVLRNGTLWAAHTVLLPEETPNRSSIQWWQLATDATVLQRGLVDSGGGRFFAFPSLAVNAHDDVLLGYSSFQDNQYAAGSYSYRTSLDPLNTMQTESVLKAGEACYFKDGGTGRNRWGDYSATVVDPDGIRLWTLQEYAAAPSVFFPFDRWGTWWGLLDPTPQIRIDDLAAAEGDAGTSVFSFRVRLTDPAGNPLATSQAVTVEWSTADNTAAAGEDYVAVSSDVLAFAPGETERTVGVTVNGDLKYEGNETFFVNLQNPTNATLFDGQAVGTILDDDPAPRVSIGDVARVEGTGASGTFTDFVFPVTLSYPSATDVTVTWATADGSAVAGSYGSGDFVGVGPTVLTIPAGNLGGSVTVEVHPDTVVEPDEAFYVDLSAPSGATLLKSRGVGRILDDDAPYPGVVGLSIVSDSLGSAATDGRNRLQFLVPSGASAATQVLVEYNEGATCTAPLTPGSGTQSVTLSLVPADFGNTRTWTHVGPGPTPPPPQLDREYCYTVFLVYPGPSYSAGASRNARPFDATGPLKWKLFTGATVMAPPTVGLDAVIGLSNDMDVHAMQRGPAGGTWPAPWRPVSLGSVAQHRAPVVPTGGVSRAFISDQNGWVHAVDTLNGTLLWSTQLPEGAAEGAPAGIFTDYGGAWSYVLVGTSAGSNNHFYALDPGTGAVIDAFPGPADGAIGGVGPIYGAAAVDYASSRVYFASRRGTAFRSLWCLEIGPPSDALRLGTTGWSRDLGVDVDGSPVLRGGRVYVVDDGPVAWSIPADTGLGGYSRSLTGPGLPGFLFPDRRNGDLYVATAGQIHGLVDTGTSLAQKWSPRGLSSPSVVLLEPGTNNLYVGVRSYGGNASLVRIDTTTGNDVGSVTLETGAIGVGAPSLDIGFDMLHVGSEAGILYGVQLPF